MAENVSNNKMGYVKIGGVKFDANQVKSQSVNVDEQSGAVKYSVFLNNGTSLEFPNQTQKHGATVFFENSENGKKLVVEKLESGKVNAGKSEQDVDIKGCKSTTIDVSDPEQKNWSDGVSINYNHSNKVTVKDYGNSKSENNKVIMGKDDVTIFNEGWQAGKGVADENLF